jgi:hypothetical protein
MDIFHVLLIKNVLIETCVVWKNRWRVAVSDEIASVGACELAKSGIN